MPKSDIVVKSLLIYPRNVVVQCIQAEPNGEILVVP